MRSPEIVRRLWGNRVAVGTAGMLSLFGTAGVVAATQQQVSEELQRVPPSRFQTEEGGPKIITFYEGRATSLTPKEAIAIDISDIPDSSIVARAYEKIRQERARREYATSLQEQNLLPIKIIVGFGIVVPLFVRFMTLLSRRRLQ